MMIKLSAWIFLSSSGHRWVSMKLVSEFSYLPSSFQNRPLIRYIYRGCLVSLPP
eukprot:UN02490